MGKYLLLLLIIKEITLIGIITHTVPHDYESLKKTSNELMDF